MPSVAENLKMWNEAYSWSDGGEEWSAAFGGTEALWWFGIFPRIHRFLPCDTILEIAPGSGRWTQFLKTKCRSYIGVDLSTTCIARCKERFASETHMSFYVNNGMSLEDVPDASVDFAFSFDSLVHAEKDVIETYLNQLARKLKPDGVGVMHHSNLGCYPGRLRILHYQRKLPSIVRRIVTVGKLEYLLGLSQAWWATSMTDALFERFCELAGLKCISQELINWVGSRCLVGGISAFAKANSKWAVENSRLENRQYMKNAKLNLRLAHLYCDVNPTSRGYRLAHRVSTP